MYISSVQLLLIMILFCLQKLHQIEQLKEKQSRGEKLEANQVCAITHGAESLNVY